MDLGLSENPAESFRLFQGRVLKEYDRMAPQYRFQIVDGTRSIDSQQQRVRLHVNRLLSLGEEKEAWS
jgi:dTMP kinase